MVYNYFIHHHFLERIMERQPNIVVFCTDHQRADYLSCAGNDLIKTPNLDRLAASGTRFENLYVQSTVCMPSRASIITGTYPCRHGVVDNGYDLPRTYKTFADVLGENGYHTMAVGRTHFICTQPRPEYPKSGFYGFDECLHAQVYCADTDPDNDYLKWVQSEHPEYYERIAFANRKLEKEVMGAHTDVPQELSMTSWVVEQSLNLIGKHTTAKPEQPFLLWAGTWDPHSPFRAPEPWGSMYDPEAIPDIKHIKEELEAYPESMKYHLLKSWHLNPDAPLTEILKNTIAMFMGMISHIDDQLGKLLDYLNENKLLDNTVIMFTSDHGDMLGEHGFIGKRIFFYDGALNVPGIIAGPGVAKGKVSSALVESVDIMPTLLDLAGVEKPQSVQGKSWLPLFNGQEDKIHDDVYTEFQYHQNKVGEPANINYNETVYSIYDGRYRIVCFKDREYGQLFDFYKDPQNHNNLWDVPKYENVKHQMQTKLLERIMANLQQPDTRLAEW